MPDINQIQINGTTYDIADSAARQQNTVQDGELDQLKIAFDDIVEQTRNLNTAKVGRYSVNYETGVITNTESSTTIFGIAEPVEVESAESYTITMYGIATSNDKCTLYVAYYNSSKEFITGSGERILNLHVANSKANYTVITPANTKYIAVSAYASGLTLTNEHIQIEKGTNSTEYIQPFIAVDLIARNDLSALDARTTKVENDIGDLGTIINVPIYEENDTALTKTTGAVLANGTTRTDYNTYEYSQKIPVSAGDVVTPVGDTDSSFRFLCAYNGSTVVPDSGVTASTVKYTVPSGIDGIVVTTLIAKHVTAVTIKHQTGTEKHIYPVTQNLGKFNWKGNLSDGDSVKLLASNVRFDVVWAFTGHVITMGEVAIGYKYLDGTVVELCAVDSTYVYYRTSDGTTVSEEHGLTITEDLQIRIDAPMVVNTLGAISVYSDGTKYTISGTAYSADMKGAPYLASDGSEMTDCAFSWIPKNIDKPIWVFGDSWVSMYDSRWPYYMKEAGYTNCWMLNGFAGEDTDEAYESLLNLLTVRKPEYLVWLLGMNNGDRNGAVNSVWKDIYDKLTALCAEYKITLILYTVPNTPTIDNSYKNAIVEASGYRYIDGVAAVGDDGAGNWFTGYEQSASDHNHTSAKGAKALFVRILTDFPEIAGNGC